MEEAGADFSALGATTPILMAKASYVGELATTEFVLGGGIDADGSVLIGGVNAAVNRDTGEQVGETFTLVEGELQRMEGAELDWEYRVRLIDAGTSVDCAVVADVTLAWVGG